MKVHGFIVEHDPSSKVRGRDSGELVVVGDAPIVVGRSPLCDIVVVDQAVNRRNCRVERDGDRFVLHDLGGTNGVWVNGARVGRTQLLAAGDVLEYRDVRLRFVCVDDDPLARPALVGGWVALDALSPGAPGSGPLVIAGRARRRVFRPGSGVRWMCTVDAHDAAAMARWAGLRPSLPAIAARLEEDGLVHVVFDLGAGARLEALLHGRRRDPLHPGDDIAGAVDDAIASRILLDATRGIAAALDFGDAFPDVSGLVVTWQGRVAFTPPAAHRDDRTGQLEALARPLLRLPGADFHSMWSYEEADEHIRAFAQRHPPADDAAMASWARALLPERWARDQLLEEQAATLDDDGVQWLVARAARGA